MNLNCCNGRLFVFASPCRKLTISLLRIALVVSLIPLIADSQLGSLLVLEPSWKEKTKHSRKLDMGKLQVGRGLCLPLSLKIRPPPCHF